MSEKEELPVPVSPLSERPGENAEGTAGNKQPATGERFWRSLQELSRSEQFEDVLRDEFPRQAMALDAGVDRRDFVKLMGASMALAGLAACDVNRPDEKIVPYVRQPEDLIPGKPLFFATAMPLSGFGYGVLAESHMNRPTKIEGNPDHPATLGASDPFMQASILGLYDPDRSQVVRNVGEISTWSAFIAALQQPLKNPRGMRLLTGTITSPTIGAQIQQILAQYPGLEWHQWEPVNRDNVREGLRASFGGYVNAVYHLEPANVIVSLDSDFLERGPGHLRYAHDFAGRRRVRRGQANAINRLYAIESAPSGVGGVADHRIPLRQSEIEDFARGLFAAVSGSSPTSPAIGAIARDLLANRGASVVLAGDDLPPAVHTIAMAINQVLGNIGSTVVITDPVEVAPVNQLQSLRELVDDMNRGAVQSLVILGGNPVFDAPADFNFVEAFKKVPFRAHLADYYNETSMLAHWHVPETHYLESWSDVRAYDGTISIVQPLIAPLYNGRSIHEVLSAVIGGLDVSPYDQVRGFWGPKIGANFEPAWRQWLNDGLIRNSALPARSAPASTAIPPATAQPRPAIELQLRPDPTIYDGRFANLAWLQELPKPQSKVTWDNVLFVSPKTADQLGFGDSVLEPLINERQTLLVDMTYRGRTIRVPIWPTAGHPDGCATLFFGHGRVHGGHVASPPEGSVGVNVYPIRFSDAMSGGGGVQIARADAGPYKIACTQEHQSINLTDMGGGERGIIHVASIGAYQQNPYFVREGSNPEEEKESFYPSYEYPGHAWAMVIDPSVCTGCNGCVIACQSENNIATVGKDQVWRERELQWLRIDRYYRGPAENPEVFNQPVPCMQCELAPCEPVCPVGATSHSSEGLNDMTYNRCVGTRYCSNNCPYKVRRFNFLFYADYDTPALKPMRNPNVTVRTRGVMEKCTYCVQRINAARIEAEKQNRRLRDGEVVTACQQACPTQAIVFGDMNDPDSDVAKLKKEPQNYGMLPDLNTRPRTTYLGIIRNPNPEIKG